VNLGKQHLQKCEVVNQMGEVLSGGESTPCLILQWRKMLVLYLMYRISFDATSCG